MIIKDSRCPKCSAEVEYNGNYWCTECRWVMQEGDRSETFKVLYVLLMQQRGEEPSRKALR